MAKREPIDEMRAVLREGRHRHAFELCAGALSDDPDNPDLLLVFGKLASLVGETQQALSALERVLAIDGKNEPGYEAYGNALMAVRRWNDAVAAYHRAFLLAPGPSHAFEGLLLALLKLGRSGEARHLVAHARGAMELTARVGHLEVIAIAMADGARAAVDAYLPRLRERAERSGVRDAWYRDEFLAGSSDVGVNSQRTGLDVLGFARLLSTVQQRLAASPNDRLLDLGGAGGLLTLGLAPFVKSVELVDISAPLVERAGENCAHLGNVSVRIDDGRTLDASPGPYERILAYGVTPVFPCHDDVRRLLRCCRARLVPGGRLLLGNNLDLDQAPAEMVPAFTSPLDIDVLLRRFDLWENALWLGREALREMAKAEGFGEARLFSLPEPGRFDAVFET